MDMSGKGEELADVITDYILANTSVLKYFERFEHDEDLLEEKLEEFCSEMDAILEEFIEELEEQDLEEMEDEEFE